MSHWWCISSSFWVLVYPKAGRNPFLLLFCRILRLNKKLFADLRNRGPLRNTLYLSLLVSSSSPTATALTDAMSESVPFFFCSNFREEIFVDLN